MEPWFVGELEIIRMKTNFPSDAGWRAEPTLLIIEFSNCVMRTKYGTALESIKYRDS